MCSTFFLRFATDDLPCQCNRCFSHDVKATISVYIIGPEANLSIFFSNLQQYGGYENHL